MSGYFKCAKCLQLFTPTIGTDAICPACSELAAPAGSVSAEEWWSHHAELLAAKMKLGGVKSFRIELNARGNYEFEVVPTATPNAPGERRRADDARLD